MYDDIMHSNLQTDENESDDGTKRRDSISRSHSLDDSISELSRNHPIKVPDVCDLFEFLFLS